MGDLVAGPRELFSRYAIYFAPQPTSELAHFGRNWLGMDAEDTSFSKPDNGFVTTPRRYGFHATLKAPMRLADGSSLSDLVSACRELASRLTIVELGQLKLNRIGTFLALTADTNRHERISRLAFECVKELDDLRAPLNETEMSKRQGLTPLQRRNLEDWGYPFVGAEFRFHMTLTSSLEPSALGQAKALLEPIIPVEPTEIDAISIFGDPGDLKPFRLIERFPLLRS